LSVPEPGLGADLVNDVTQLYLNKSPSTLLSASDEQRSPARRQGDFAARQRLLEHSLRLVVGIAKHYQPRPRAAGPDRGRQSRPDARARQFDASALPVLDLYHLVDPSGSRARDHESVADHSPPASSKS
jgi:hypothetical protein